MSVSLCSPTAVSVTKHATSTSIVFGTQLRHSIRASIFLVQSADGESKTAFAEWVPTNGRAKLLLAQGSRHGRPLRNRRRRLHESCRETADAWCLAIKPHRPDGGADRGAVRPSFCDRRDLSRPKRHALWHVDLRARTSRIRRVAIVSCCWQRSLRGYSLCSAQPAKQAASTAPSRPILSRNVRTPYSGKVVIGISRFQNLREDRLRLLIKPSGKIVADHDVSRQLLGFIYEGMPQVQNPLSSQSLNRYSYVLNNPLRFIDPSGFDPTSSDDSNLMVWVPGGKYDRGHWENADGTIKQYPTAPKAAAPQGKSQHSANQAHGGAAQGATRPPAPEPAAHDAKADSNTTGQPSGPAPAAPTAGPPAPGPYMTLGAAEGLVPFGTLGSDLSPPPTARGQMDLGAGQLLGAATALQESAELTGIAGTLASAGALAAATGIGAPLGAALEVAAGAAEIASVVVSAGALVNAATGAYNMTAGAARGGGGAGTGKSWTSGNVSRPAVSDPKLNNLMDNMYKPGSSVGNGSTADAVRSELATGQPVGGRFHTIKAQETIQGLNNWLARNPSASAGDIAGARAVLQDLTNALAGN